MQCSIIPVAYDDTTIVHNEDEEYHDEEYRRSSINQPALPTIRYNNRQDEYDEDEMPTFLRKGERILANDVLINQTGIMKITPSCIDFGVCRKGIKHTKTVFVKNLGQMIERVRYDHIRNPNVKIYFREGTSKLAPGIGLGIDIQISGNAPIRETLVIHAGTMEVYEIPIRADFTEMNIVASPKHEIASLANMPFLSYIPRISNTTYNLKTKELCFESANLMELQFDADQSIDDYIKDLELRRSVNIPVPSGHVRIHTDTRPWDLSEESARDYLDNGILLEEIHEYIQKSS